MSLIHTSKLLFNIGTKILELHQAGVDKQIVADIHSWIEQVKSVIDDHHQVMVDTTDTDTD